MNSTEDLEELDRIWPLGKQLVVPDGGTVLVAGAYQGRYVDYILTRFKPGKVIGYEPQSYAYNIAVRRLERHEGRWDIHPMGIGVHDCHVTMEGWGTDGCKVSNENGTPNVRLISIEKVLDKYGPFDLFICNMEGYEIPLLSYLLVTGRINEIKSLAVQFHSTDTNLLQILEMHYGTPIYDEFPTWCYFLYDKRLA